MKKRCLCPLFTVSCRVIGGHTFLNARFLSVLFLDLLPLFDMADLSPVVFTSCYLHLDIWADVFHSYLHCADTLTPPVLVVSQVTRTTTAWVPWALARCWAPSPPSSSTPTQRPCWDAPSRPTGSRSWRSSWRTTQLWGQHTSSHISWGFSRSKAAHQSQS